MKKKKLILEWEEEMVGNNVLGIVSAYSHLEFVHNLNKTGYFNLERNIDLEIETNTDSIFFIRFTNHDHENSNTYTLIKNKGTAGILGKEFKGLDYILINNPENTESFLSLKEIINHQKFVQAVMELDIQKLSEKSKQILGF
ncbi:MAG: IPExxxVDY family protein [Bacteroidia bacterium]